MNTSTPSYKKTYLTLGLLFISFFGYSQSPSTFTSSVGTLGTYSWVCPRGVTSITVEAIGGGAGGITSGPSKGNVGGGGGGGAYSKRVAVAVSPGTSYDISIGGGGGADTAGGTVTAIFGAKTITAAGGSIGAGGVGGLGGTVLASVGDAGNVFAGGAGGNGNGSSGAGGAGAGGGGGSGGGSSSNGNAGGNALNTSTGGSAGATIATYGGAGGAGGNQSTIGANASSTNYGGGGGGGGEKGMSGGSGQPGAIIITFTCPTETANAGPDQTVCTSTATLAGNTPTNGTGIWTVSGTGTATITTPSSPTSGVTGLSGTVTLTWTINNGRCGNTASDDVVITRNTTPTITTQPVATSVCTTGTTTLSVVATGVTTYQWRKGGVALTNVAPYSNVTTATLTITNPASGDAGNFDVVLNSATCPVTSNAVALTVNATPTISTQPVATSVCTTGTATFSVTATGATTYQWRKGGVALTNTGPYSNVTTATLTITNPAVGDAGNFDVIINSATCPVTSSTVVLTVNTVPTAAITPSQTNGTTGVCYEGTTPVTSVSWAAVSGATSYDVYFGAGSLPGSVTSNVATNSYSTGTLLASTTYYWKVVAKNACGDATGSITWTFTTASSPCVMYCEPTSTSTVDGTGITNVAFSSVINPSNDTGVYNNYTATQIGDAIQGSQMNISVTTRTKETGPGGKDKKYNIIIWVDWNNDGDFIDANEEVVPLGNVTSNTYFNTINIPLTASTGYHRLRIGITKNERKNNIEPTPCNSNNANQAAYEDYTLNITAIPIGCTLAPTVTTSPSNSAISSGNNTSFTATFANSPTSYVWEVCTDGGGINFTPITNGGVYSGATAATLTITAATGGMTGFKYRIYASNACGKSDYPALATLTVTTATPYCPASSTANTYWIANFSSLGNLKDTSKTSIYTVGGYADYTSTTIATQVPGGGMNFSITTGTSISDPNNRQYIACYVDWNGDGDFKDIGEDIYNPGAMGLLETTFGVVVPVSQNLGNYRLRIRTKIKDGIIFQTNNANMCTNYTTGETEDYTIAVVQDCASKIQAVTNVTQCGSSTVTLNVVGLGGTTEYRWYTAETGGTPFTKTSTGTWTTPVLSTTTTYYVTSFNGSCESLVRTPIVITVIPTTIINFSPTNPVACGEDSIISIGAAGGTTVVTLFTEDFEDTTNKFTVTTPTNAGSLAAPWSVKTNTFQSPTLYWKPAVSSGEIDTNFAFTSSDYGSSNIVTRLSTTSAINTVNYVSLTMTFRHYFSFYTGVANRALVQVSTDNFVTWTDEKTYTIDSGSASKFTVEKFDLPIAYLNQTNLKFRFQYEGTFSDGWAIDDVRLYGTKQLNTTFSWTTPPGTTINAYTDDLCTTLYNPTTSTPTSNIWLKPDLSQLESTEFPITITATLENSCPVSKLITVTNNTKVWRGIVPGMNDTNLKWDDAANWRPVGVPTASNCVIGPENTVISGTNYNAYAKNVVVKSTGTFEIQAGNNLTVTDFIKVETGGVFNLKNNASIVQLTDVANTGNVNIQRITQPMNYYDYTYWNSPVTAGSNFTFASLSPGTSSDIWSYTPTVSGGSGNWVRLSSSTVMSPTKGYIVKAPDTFSSSTKVAYNATFVGTPNNGPILAPISKGSDANLGGLVTAEDDEWNLIGNPYPSGLDAKKFLDLPANTNVVDGTIYIWTHITAPSAAAPDQFYGDYVLNYTSDDYASFNKTGGTGTASSATTGGNAPSGFIASGQSFFVKAAPAMANVATLNATFNNSMRVTNNSDAATGTNSDFFKKRNNPKTVTIAEEKHRVWLNLTNNSGAFSQTLVGYLTDATQGLDRSFDGESFGGNDVTFYSIIPEANLTIQGRSLPFDPNDIVTLGYNAAKKGNYSIRIDHLDGLFDKQDIYLEDKDLNVLHDLKKKPYVFNTKVGDFNNRFVLRYGNSNKTLGLEENTLKSDAIKIAYAKNSNILTINNNSVTIPVEKVTLFNIAGQSIATWKIENQEQQNIQIPIKSISSGIYIAKLKTSEGEQSKKIIIP